MKVLITANYSSVYSGNFIPSILSLASKLENEGHIVGFGFNSNAKNTEWCNKINGNTEVYFFSSTPNCSDVKEFNDFLRNNQYDVIYDNFSSRIVLMVSLINRKIKYVRHVHTDMGEVYTRLNKFIFNIKKCLFYQKMINVYVSEQLKDFENTKYSYFVQNALDTTRFNENNTSSIGLKLSEKKNSKSYFPVILLFGWHTYVKGVDIALKSFEKILLFYPEAVLLVVRGSNTNNKKMNEYANYYVDKKTLEHIFFLPPMQDVEKYHRAADIFLSCSRSEGFSYSMLEGLYLGESIVSSDLPSVQWGRNFKDFYYFESENVNQCFYTIDKCIKNLKNKDTEENVRTTIYNNFNIDNWTNTIYNIIVSEKNEKKGGV